MKKPTKIILWILFPLGLLYCIGKSLFGGSFANFLGGVTLFGIGMLVSIYFFRPDIVSPVITFVRNIFT